MSASSTVEQKIIFGYLAPTWELHDSSGCFLFMWEGGRWQQSVLPCEAPVGVHYSSYVQSGTVSSNFHRLPGSVTLSKQPVSSPTAPSGLSSHDLLG